MAQSVWIDIKFFIATTWSSNCFQSRSSVLLIGQEHSTVDFYSLLRSLAPELDSARQNDLKLDKLPYLRSIVAIGDGDEQRS